jgi:hypothetical protein
VIWVFAGLLLGVCVDGKNPDSRCEVSRVGFALTC